MKIKLSVLVDAEKALEKLVTCPKLPTKLNFRLMKLSEVFVTESKTYHKTLSDLCKQFGEEGEKAGTYTFTKLNFPLFQAETTLLAEQEIDWPEDSLIPADVLETVEDTGLSPIDLLFLKPFFKPPQV